MIWVRVAMRLSFDEEESLKAGVESLQFYNPPSDPNTPAQGCSSGMVPRAQERNEDICFNNSESQLESDLNSLLRE